MVFTIMAGILAAIAIQIRSSPMPAPSETMGITVRELVIGTPLDGSTSSPVGVGKLATRADYGPTDPIGLRISTQAPAETVLQLTVRLVRPDGTFAQIIPATVQLTQGDSGYCCWTIGESGRYSLQVFRPDGKLSSIPLRIR